MQIFLAYLAAMLGMLFLFLRFLRRNIESRVFGLVRRLQLQFVYVSTILSLFVAFYSYVNASYVGTYSAAAVWVVSFVLRTQWHQPGTIQTEELWGKYWDFGSPILLRLRRWSPFAREIISDFVILSLFSVIPFLFGE